MARPIESEEIIDIQLYNYNKYLSNRYGLTDITCIEYSIITTSINGAVTTSTNTSVTGMVLLISLVYNIALLPPASMVQ